MYIIDKLDNGIQVVMEKIDYVNSVSIGLIIKNGSIYEDKTNNGVSHFIEHMLFKGTKSRKAKQIAESIDNIGGQLNAFTGKEQTCFYAKVLDQHLPIAIDVLGDMLTNSLFNQEEIQKEKGVIIEEINMYLDEPEDLVYELLNELMFKGSSLELPILGTEDSVSTLSREAILDYFYDKYTSDNIIISLAGKLDSKETMKLLNNSFNIIKKSKNPILDNISKDYRYKNNIKGIEKNFEQLNFCIGMEGVNVTSEDIHPTMVMNNVFGGSMSSRLFQSIREDHGLAYSVYSNLSPFEHTGIFSIYAGLKSTQLLPVVELIEKEIKNLKKALISKEELIMSKEQLKGNYILGTEGTFSRMFENGKSLSILGRIESPKEIIEKIHMVSMEDIERVVNHIFNKEQVNIAYVGNIYNAIDVENKVTKILFNWGDYMQINIVNKSNNGLPSYKTSGSSGIDLQAFVDSPVTLKPLDRQLIPTGLYISIPKGYEGQIRGRSGLALKHGITLANAVGTIDSDYRGELKIILINLGNEDFTINNGDRIAQMIFTKYERAQLNQVNELDDTVRGQGGFGHTGL